MVVGHPYWPKSFANRHVVEEFQRLVPNAVVSNLYELYPDGKIDVEAEQAKLVAADIVVLQFPIMWYSCPSLMHAWQEQVLSYGFAYGHGGEALKGKKMVCSFTAASTPEMYSKWGVQGITVDQMMPPFYTLAPYCHMEWKGYIYSGGMIPHDDKSAELIAGRAADHAYRLAQLISRIS